MGAGMSAVRMRIALMVSVLMVPVLSTVAMLIRTAQQQSAAHVSAISAKTQPAAQIRTVRQETVLMESAPVMSVSRGRPVQTMAAHQNASLTRTARLTNGATPLRVSASQVAEQVITAQQNHAVSVLTTSVLTQSAVLMMIVQMGTALRMEHVPESATKTLTAQQSHAVSVWTTIALTRSAALMMIVQMVTVTRMAHVRESAMMMLTAKSSLLWSAVCARTSSAQILSAAPMRIVILAISVKTIPVSKKENAI